VGTDRRELACRPLEEVVVKSPARSRGRASHIVAIGGAAFRAEPENLAIDRYILDLTGRERPKVCLIPTASAEPAEGIARFYDVYTRLGATPSVLRFFDRTPALRATLLSQDVISAGGGNTKSMLAVWREWDLPLVLRQAWRRGIVLAGVSAGAICWFEQGVTDSWADRLRPLDCLGFLANACCPHFDSEEERRPSVQTLLKTDRLQPVLALDDGAAAHFVGRRLERIVTWRTSARGYSLRRRGARVIEAALPAHFLPAHVPR
jgi:peptidase E